MLNDNITTLNKITVTKEYMHKSVLLLKTTASYFNADIKDRPQIERYIYSAVDKDVNRFLDYTQTTMLKEAFAVYKDSVDGGFNFNNYESFLEYLVTLNTPEYLSYYIDDYSYTGGAHGNTLRKSLTFDMKNGKTLTLKHFFEECKHYENVIMHLIADRADANYLANPGIYFEDYNKLLLDYFNPDNFYLTEKGIVIYYQQYQIAPYSTGIVGFEIPYSYTKYC